MVKYINEIIRTNYKCNLGCKFCNVWETNNYGDKDKDNGKVIEEIINLSKKYTKKQLKNTTLSFSGGEPLLNKYIKKYIKLAKNIGVGTVDIQTNGTILFSKKEKIKELSKSGLDEVFIALHSHYDDINKTLGTYLNKEKIEDWVKYINNYYSNNKKNEELASIYLNIVITKINLPYILSFLKYLKEIGFINLIESREHNINNKNTSDHTKNTRKISMGFVQPNGYAWENREDLLLSFNKKQQKEIGEVIEFCENNNLLPDIHFVGPPLCLLNYPKYNLEYQRLKKLHNDKKKGKVNRENLESYKNIWKEKIKTKECNKCKYNSFCLGFYKGWVNYFGIDYANKRAREFIKNN